MGVVTGNDVQKLFDLAKRKNFAIPAVNVVGSNSINATLETAKKLNAPVIIQFSNGGCQFFSGKGLSNDCLLYTSPSPRDVEESRMPSSA